MPPPLLVLLLFCAGFAAWFIYRTSFEVDGIRFYCLFDDAMISMRYAKNLAAGMGMVWNVGGERVEGFTNPLWVLYMAIFHLVPLSAAKISLCIQISEAICLALTIVMVRKLSLLLFPGSKIAEYGPAVLTATYMPLLNWSLQGMEVGPLALLLVWSLWLAFSGIKEGHVRASFYLILGAITFIRLDVVPMAILLLACLALADPRGRRRHLLVGVGILLLSLSIQSLLRFGYYGEFLPNTYYLKATGIPLAQRLARGGDVFLEFASGMSWQVFFLPFLALSLAPTYSIATVVALVITQCVYSVYVGGDAWEWWGGSNRYIAVIMPMFFILLGGTLTRLRSLCEPLVARRPRLLRPLVRLVMLLVFLISLFQLNRTKFSASLEDWFDGGMFLVAAASGMQPHARSSEVVAIVNWLTIPGPLLADGRRTKVMAAMLLDSITTPKARVAVGAAGTLPYFSSREFIDLLGKNDKTIARGQSRPIVEPSGRVDHMPGHSKWSYAHSIGELKPDVIYELWFAEEEARPFLEAAYQAVDLRGHRWYVRRGSENIRWDVLAQVADDRILQDGERGEGPR